MKQKLRRILSIVMALAVAFTAFAVTANASAEDDRETTGAGDVYEEKPWSDLVKVTVEADKSEYTWDDTIVFHITVENISDEALSIVDPISKAAAEDIFAPYVDRREIYHLQPGESETITHQYSAPHLSPIKRFFRIISYFLGRLFGTAAINTEEYPNICSVKVGALTYDFGFGVLIERKRTITDIDEVVSLYNEAHKATKPAPTGHSVMRLDGDITGDGALGGVLKVASPIIQNTLEKNSVEIDYIPGRGRLLASDVVGAKAVVDGNVTEITIQLKEQTDGPQADAYTGGPVARGIGTLGNINNAIESLGAELYSGKETISLTYKDAYIRCRIDNSTGKIVGGTWHYAVHAFVGEAEVKLGLKFTAKNLRGVVDYTVTI